MEGSNNKMEGSKNKREGSEIKRKDVQNKRKDIQNKIEDSRDKEKEFFRAGEITMSGSSRLAKTGLFRGFTGEEVEGVLGCLSARPVRYRKGEFVFHMGDTITSVGMVLEGSVQIIHEDAWGDRQVLARMGHGQLFGESYACAAGEPLMVSVVALEDSQVLFLDVKKMMTVCSSACRFHSRLIQNLLSIMAVRNLTLTAKIDHMGRRTIRDKVLSYLSWQSEKQGKRKFDIPFNRQQLADYLAVDRSALSAELSKMQKEGMIEFKRNHFCLSI